jgi:hypothetical protein
MNSASDTRQQQHCMDEPFVNHGVALASELCSSHSLHLDKPHPLS